jgi:short-subunit dehydrogenase
MARVFITGSTDGLGRMAAELLIGQGYQVVLHARNPMACTRLGGRFTERERHSHRRSLEYHPDSRGRGTGEPPRTI